MLTAVSERHRSRPATLLLHCSLLAASALLGACSTTLPGPQAAPSAVETATWQTPLPHGGQVGDLARWWQQFDDPLLSALVDASQRLSPSLASARARIAQSRAAWVAAGASLQPRVDAGASLTRGRFDLGSPTGTSLAASVQARWEADLFGAHQAGQEATLARLEGAEASWHEARVSLAAEVGSLYLNLRACEAQLAQTRLDAQSREETARLTGLSAGAGMSAPASAALAQASAAQARAGITQARASCDALVKGLVALTGTDEPALRQQLSAGTAQLPRPAQISVARVPAEALAQRPDIYRAARELVAASADTRQAQAQHYPTVSLAGSLGPARFETSGFSQSGLIWSLGPLSVSLPLFDAGQRGANLDAARSRYEAARVAYQAGLRQAVREVEEALLALQSTNERLADAELAARGLETSYNATNARYRGGMASLFELEDARRTALAAQSALIDLRRERVAAWISLYRALGGGWMQADVRNAATQP